MRTIIQCVLLILSTLVFSQNCDLRLQGNVRDFHNNLPSIFAQIVNRDGTISAVTDDQGNFLIENLCPGTYHFTVIDTESELKEFTVQIEENTQVNWHVEHHVIELEGLERQGTLRALNLTARETHLHRDALQEYAANDIAGALKKVSGISSLESGSNIAKPVIHGMHSSRVVLVNMGIRQEDMDWGAEHAPTININGFDDLIVLKGSSSLRYSGDALGGIIVAELPSTLRRDTLQGEFGLTGLWNGRGGSSYANILKTFKSPWEVYLHGSVRRTGDMQAPNYNLQNSGVAQYNYLARVGYNTFERKYNLSYSEFFTQLGILQAAHIGNVNNLLEAIESGEPAHQEEFSYRINRPYQNIRHRMVKAYYEQRFRNLGKWENMYALQINRRQEYDMRLGEQSSMPNMDIRLTTQRFESVFSFDRHANSIFTTGVQGMIQNNYSDPATGVKRLIPDYDQYSGAWFGTWDYVRNQWGVSAGLRYDYVHIDSKKYYSKRYWDEMGYDQDFADNIIGDFGTQWLAHFKRNFHNIAATIGLMYERSPWEKLTINLSRASRAPNPAELFSEGLHHSAASIEMGDVRLKPENGYKLSVGYSALETWNRNLSFSLNGHAHQVQNFIYQIPTGLQYTIRGAFPVWNFKQVNAIMLGMDLDIGWRFDQGTSLQAQASYLYGQDTENKQPLIHIPPFKGNIILGHRFGNQNQWNTSITAEYTARQLRFPDFNPEVNILQDGEFVSRTVDLSTPTADYLLWNAQIGYQIPIQNKNLKLNLHIYNLMNSSYRNYLNRFRYFADEPGRQIQLQAILEF
ncbi:MAG: TonB-dependent receptor [Weeksellaceae bacterium]|nr:TonB-dependent receptor [Weeksellaceae bacterium]